MQSVLTPELIDCTPLDEFIEEVAEVSNEVGDELGALIECYTNQMLVQFKTIETKQQEIRTRYRLECYYWLVSEVIKLLEHAEICQENAANVNIGGGASLQDAAIVADTVDATNSAGQPLYHQIQKALDRLPEFRYGRISAQETPLPSDLPEEILQIFDDCVNVPSREALLNINKRFSQIIGERK